MKKLAVPTFAILVLTTAGALALQDSGAQDPGAPGEVPVSPQHKWLKQFVGEWTVKSNFVMEGMPPMSFDATEKTRAIGNYWIVSEGKATMMGMPMSWMLTLGYDPKEESFVGTWVDTSSSHLWTYTGSLDEEKNVLTLESEGPSFADPTKMAKYRETFTMKDADTRTSSSAILGEDGKWTTFVNGEFKRKK